VSKQRAQRRAQRAAVAAQASGRAEDRRLAQVERRRRRSTIGAALRRAVGLRPRPVRTATGRARARRWAPIIATLFVLNVVGWVLWTSVTGRVLVAVVTVALLPLIAIWLTDAERRGPGRYGRRL